VRPLHPLQRQRDGKDVIVVGAGEQAEIADERLTDDSPHTVVAFAVERPFLNGDRFRGRPLIALDEMATHFSPDRHRALVALSFIHLNRVRSRLVAAVRAQGFVCVSYVSSCATVWHDVQIGENCFVLDRVIIEREAKISDNVILWAGSIVAHRTTIGSDCFLGPGSVVAGFCTIGSRSFLGVNSCVADGRTLGEDSVLGAGAVVISDTEPRSVNVGNPARPTGRDSLNAFQVSVTETR
jgi:sugar O-acyltransferase (sialic acid O-acetyltransferase NeuD family)